MTNWLETNWLAILVSTGRWMRKYAVLVLVLALLIFDLVGVLQNGMGPRPQLPPDGYEAEQGSVTLQWNRGNRETPITLQIADNPEFEAPIYENTVSGITHFFRTDLKRGQTYYWRVLQAPTEDAEEKEASNVMTFTISPQHVNL